MARHRDPARPSATALSKEAREAVEILIIDENFDSDRFDRIVEAQRVLFDDPDQPKVYKLKCQACLILIGPGYHETEVWIDGRGRWVCRGCARWNEDDQCEQLASPDEVAEYSITDLYQLLIQRTKERTA